MKPTIVYIESNMNTDLTKNIITLLKNSNYEVIILSDELSIDFLEKNKSNIVVSSKNGKNKLYHDGMEFDLIDKPLTPDFHEMILPSKDYFCKNNQFEKKETCFPIKKQNKRSIYKLKNK